MLPYNGNGFIIIPDSADPAQTASGCSEASHNYAYKNLVGAQVGFQIGAHKMVASEMTVIDNGIGIIVAPAYKGNPAQKVVGQASKIKIFAETEAPDCPQDGKGGYCYTFDKRGMLAPSFYEGSKAVHPIKPVQ